MFNLFGQEYNEMFSVLDNLRKNIGMDERSARNLYDKELSLVMQKPLLSLPAFDDWMCLHYPEYRDRSIEQFLQDRDSANMKIWKQLFGISD